MMLAEQGFEIGVAMAPAIKGYTSGATLSVAMCYGHSSMEINSGLDHRCGELEMARVSRNSRTDGSLLLENPDSNRKLGRGLAFWTWEPPNAMQQFNKIRDITVVLNVFGGDYLAPSRETGILHPFIRDHLCTQLDILHKIVNRLLTLDQPLRNLSFDIQLPATAPPYPTFYLEMTKWLLRPFVRLGVRPQLLNIVGGQFYSQETEKLHVEISKLFLGNWASNLNVDVDVVAYRKAVASFIQYYLLILTAIDENGHGDRGINEEVWSAIVRRTLIHARVARESGDVATLDRLHAGVQASMSAMRAEYAVPAGPRAPVLADKWPAELWPEPAMRDEELLDILTSFSYRERWADGYEKRFPQTPEFWLRTGYPQMRLRNTLWAAMIAGFADEMNNTRTGARESGHNSSEN